MKNGKYHKIGLRISPFEAKCLRDTPPCIWSSYLPEVDDDIDIEIDDKDIRVDTYRASGRQVVNMSIRLRVQLG